MHERPDDERRLIEAAQADPAHFLELYERNFARVYAYVSRRVPDRPAAEDVTSQVFEQALRHISEFEWRGKPFVAWLFRIAANAIADRWRQDAREARAADVEEVADVDEDVERRVLLFQLVERLAEPQRTVIQMRFGAAGTPGGGPAPLPGARIPNAAAHTTEKENRNVRHPRNTAGP